MRDRPTLTKAFTILGKPKIELSWILLMLNGALAILYFCLITTGITKGNVVLFGLLVISELFHLWQTLSYIITVWNVDTKNYFDSTYKPSVDIFITVAGEPIEIIRKTAVAALEIDYPKFEVYLLNDGFTTSKNNWRDIEELARELGIQCFTRKVSGGAKAGNINYALTQSRSEYVAIFDADHVPKKQFLQKLMGYFGDPKVAFVQSPQYYKNHSESELASVAWEQQELFFDPICRGKNSFNSTFMCGTNMIIRRSALEECGGMCETNIAEDFLTSLFIHEKGWRSVYVPEILAEGLAPEDFFSYYKQQLRWARGSLEVIFKYNPIWRKGLDLGQKIQYLASASYYLSGIVVTINLLLPLIFLYTGFVPLETSTMQLAGLFLPYIFLNIYTLQRSNSFNYTFRALAFSFSSFEIFNRALVGVLSGKPAQFSITSKTKIKGNFVQLVSIHLTYTGVCIFGIVLALLRNGITASVITNTSWIILNSALFFPFIRAAIPEISVLEPVRSFTKNQIQQWSRFATTRAGFFH